jgi:photosystem II stability/assembly factor-like uncharacterized protein
MNHFLKAAITASLMLSCTHGVAAKSNDDDTKSLFNSKTFEAMSLRNIGPAYMSGRISDIAVDQQNPSTWYSAVASGGVWKTINSGTTWTPLFDKEAVYSTGDVTIDPSNSNIIWVGTGENNGGRHISFGDGIYKSLDGGKTWNNMGLKNSERISDIIIHPTNSDIIWAAVQGPLWTSGGERGLYKTTDGGKTWKQALKPDDKWTGVTSLLIDPRNPDKLYAATWARQRTVASFVGTGPGSGIHTSDDGGETWTTLKTGLPKGNMGKIGMAISPMNPDIVYATIEIDNRKGGFYRSADQGASWVKMSDEVGGGTGPHYYQEIFADQHNFDRVYIASNYSKVSNDGGKTWIPINTKRKHVDDHAFAFHPTDPDFVLIGSDGGIYMSHDRMENFRFIANLPITQFYKVAPDDAAPFYNVYAGAQDNSTQGGPSRTKRKDGIKNKDWFLTLGGDGHQPAVEPGNPNIMYSQWQQGNLMRHDLKTRENVYVKPQARPGEPAERYNWDAPINVSSHDPKRIYHASQRVWRSDDRGDSWTPISADLTKNGNRMHMPMMGRTWSVESGLDIYAMSNYHTIANFSESAVDPDVLWVGTDDGLIQVTTDGGKNWKKIDLSKIKGIPDTAYINDIRADLHDRETVYVALDNHKYGDFKPYLIKSTNLGKKWKSLAKTLPEKHLVWRIVQDHINKDLLFLGTEFGLFFTVNAGESWLELDGGMPTIATRDVKIQRRENDLVVGTFGRGIYILDDYSPLRHLTEKAMEQEALLFAPGRPTKLFKLDTSHSDSDGDDNFSAKNPEHGATLTYFLKDSVLSEKEKRQKAEKKMVKEETYPKYPSWEAIEAENNQEKPVVYIEINDAAGNLVNRIAAKPKKGLHRITWDMTYAKGNAITGNKAPRRGGSLMAAPGAYTATLYKRIGSNITPLAKPVQLTLQAIDKNSLNGTSSQEALTYSQNVTAAQKQASAARAVLNDINKTMASIRIAIDRTPGDIATLEKQYFDIQAEINAINVTLFGLKSRDRKGTKPATVTSRLRYAMSAVNSSYGPTKQHKEQLGYALDELNPVINRISTLQKSTLPALQKAMDKAGSPWTTGSLLID